MPTTTVGQPSATFVRRRPGGQAGLCAQTCGRTGAGPGGIHRTCNPLVVLVAPDVLVLRVVLDLGAHEVSPVAADLGLGRIVALCCRSSTPYQIQ